MDTLMCKDKEDAKYCIENIGAEFVYDWLFLENGKIELLLIDGWNYAKLADVKEGE